jgi:hypothetical protein
MKKKALNNLIYKNKMISIINKVKIRQIQIKFLLAFMYKCYKKSIIKKSKMIRKYNQLKEYLQNFNHKFIYIQKKKLRIKKKYIFKYILSNTKMNSSYILPWEL